MPKAITAKVTTKTALRKKSARASRGPGRRSKAGGMRGAHSALSSLLPNALTAESEGADAPTDRQLEIYAFIRDKIHSRGFGPTVREIGHAFKIRSPNGVVCHLKALERKGLITRGKNMSRAIELVTEPAHLRGLPLAGWVAAGTLRAAEEQKERIDFEELFNRDNHFVLKVMGDSMIDAQIADGDYVVIKPSTVAADGDIVVAQVEENEVTLKQLFRESGRVRLQPANRAYAPMYYPTVNVQGVLVGVLRRVH